MAPPVRPLFPPPPGSYQPSPPLSSQAGLYNQKHPARRAAPSIARRAFFEVSNVPDTQPERDGPRSVGIGLIGIGFMGGIHARAYRSGPWIFPDAAARPDLRVVADLR